MCRLLLLPFFLILGEIIKKVPNYCVWNGKISRGCKDIMRTNYRVYFFLFKFTSPLHLLFFFFLLFSLFIEKGDFVTFGQDIL